MTNDDENTARELIENALADAVTTVETPQQLAEMIAAGLRDDEHHKQRLAAIEPHAMLFRVNVHELGKLNNEPRRHTCGALELEALAAVPHSTPDLLDHLAATGNTYGYALAMHSTPPDQPHSAIVLLLATRDGLQLAAVAVDDNDKSADGYLIENDTNQHDQPIPPEMAATLKKLAAAVARTAKQ